MKDFFKKNPEFLYILIAQAALAFQLWRGVLPDIAPVLAQLAGEGG